MSNLLVKWEKEKKDKGNFMLRENKIKKYPIVEKIFFDLPAATFNRGCSFPMRIKSAEFRLLKLVESSIGSCKSSNLQSQQKKENKLNLIDKRN